MSWERFQYPVTLLEMSLTEVVESFQPERAFVAYRPSKSNNGDFPKAYATHGFSMSGLYTDEDISSEVIRKTLRDGESQLIVDAISAPELTNRTSVIISGLRSILTVPLTHPSGLVIGLFYIDNRVKTGAFKKNDQESLSRIARGLVASLSDLRKRGDSKDKESSFDSRDFTIVRTETLSLTSSGRTSEALALITRWIRGREESEQVGIAYGLKSRMLQQLGAKQEAFEAASMALFIVGHLPRANKEHYALFLNNLASLHVELENHERARGLFTSSLAHLERLSVSDPKHFASLAANQHNLGKLNQKQNATEAARAWFTQALSSSSKAFGEEHPKTLKIQSSLEELGPAEN